jgi:hypothetical protein
VAEEPTLKAKDSGGRGARQRRLILLVAGLLIIAAVVIVIVVAVRHDSVTDTTQDSGGSATAITSPYDLHELPAGTAPGDVQNASLVSISLPGIGGASDYYGISADNPAAKALIQAVAGADQVDSSEAPTITVLDTTTSGAPASAATLTFLFPDRSTLAFDLYVEQGLIGRGGHFWRVDGDLAALVQAAVSANEQQ